MLEKKFSFYKGLTVLAAALAVTAMTLTSCASAGKTSQKAILAEEPARMFWSISGTDAKGNPSKVYIQGTVHVGDSSLYPFADTVLSAWSESDRIFAEISAEDLQSAAQEIAVAVQASLPKADGKNLLDYLSDEEKEAYLSLIPEESATQFALFEPWVSQYILTSLVMQNSGYTANYGPDVQFYSLAIQQGLTVQGLDQVQDQIDAMVFGTYDQQLAILKDTLADVADPESFLEELRNMFKAYVDNDKAALATILDEDSENLKDQDWYGDYQSVMLYKRNQSWADQIKGFLSEGGTTFIFAGCGHFLGDNNVFEYLKKNGTL